MSRDTHRPLRHPEDPETPVFDFVRSYAASDSIRLHMPGHKGRGPLGCECYDITEVAGADALYEAGGIIAESESTASELFGSRQTLYATEGSSQCIRAMVYLAAACRRKNIPGEKKTGMPDGRPVLVAARNAHRSFLHACALADADVVWLWPEDTCAAYLSGPQEVSSDMGRRKSLMRCPVSPAQLDQTLSSLKDPCCGVYLTSPDYTGFCQDIAAMSEVCHRHGVPLLVDNAHGAYLHFLPAPRHPLDLGADLCCDSAHKTLPVLTGGAYLHISGHAPAVFSQRAKDAMALFGSTSPSYLTLASLDLCNVYLARKIHDDLAAVLPALADARVRLLEPERRRHPADPQYCSDSPCFSPLHLAIPGDGAALAAALRRAGMEPEYAGPDALILLFSPRDSADHISRAADVLHHVMVSQPHGQTSDCDAAGTSLCTSVGHFVCSASEDRQHRPEQVMHIREAVFSDCETIPVETAAGRIAAMPAASCPPAIPPVMPGERITPEAVQFFLFYGYKTVCVVC